MHFWLHVLVRNIVHPMLPQNLLGMLVAHQPYYS